MEFAGPVLNYHRKRINTDNGEGVLEKIARYYVTLEEESDDSSKLDDDAESVHSWQDKETEYVRDTSDSSSHTPVSDSDSDLVEIEYEAASLSEREDPFPDGSTSEPEEIIMDVIEMEMICDSDLNLADDSNDSITSVDSEIGRADYWTCVICKTNKKNSLFRYCEKCYQIRKNFFPPRPKGKRRRLLEKSFNKSIHNEKIQELIDIDSGLTLSQGSESSATLLNFCADPSNVDNTTSKILPAPNENTPSCSTNDKCELPQIMQKNSCLESSNKESKEHFHVNKQICTKLNSETDRKKDLNSSNESSLCLICTLNPKNGAFVHGNIIHICCCYHCAVKIWRKNSYCPICNRKITKVLKAFYS
ncbi:E3 ubiquitin-protein ligase Mdm2-like [Prorops nasuta]|uniref:E3 ubiquitin-protein ligase Mdm2-like n=1 Tax=Prorops nasuta TaxID=863751 RepID=UPI0034CEB2BE